MNNWLRLGIWIALTAGFYFLVNEVLQHDALYQTWRWHIWKGLMGGGAFLCLLSKLFKTAPQAAPASAGSQNGGIRFHDDEKKASSAPVFTLRYFGLLLSTFGLVVRVVIPDNALGLKIAAREDPAREPVVETPASTNVEPLVIEFPFLNVKGIFYSKTKPSAFVNNKTYFVGDRVEGAKIVSIEPDSIVVEKGGSQKTFMMKH